MSSGTNTMMASHFCTLAVSEMPRCWIAKMISIRMPPMKKVALILAVARKGMLKLRSDQLRIAGVSAAIPSVPSNALTASSGVVPAWAAIYSATRGLSAVMEAACAEIQSRTICESAAGIG